ncbi:MAG TPA: SusD/RagB family nutrient-binding outer membrane lipoprotein [Candidatus Acidoferrales bacterium]|nr:SusD/RagB family nutrient-binding outer membrane lipoprotein [Candidatus Acidoferrales bacterium]
MKTICKYAISALLVAAVIAGCKSFTKGYENNPIASASAPASTIFTSSQVSFDLFMEGFSSYVAALWSQEATGTVSQFIGYYVYTASSQDFNNDWGLAYNNVGYDLRLVEAQAAKDGNPTLEGAAKVVEGIQMGTVADLWGDVPYSQAFQPTVYLQPKYDPQDSVYSRVQATLDAGIAELTQGASDVPGDAFSSAGSNPEWVKAAHTAKARFLMHSARHGGYAANAAVLAQVIAQCQQGILATDGSEDFTFLHTGGVWNGDLNLWNSFLTVDRAGYMDASATFVIPMMNAAKLDGKTNYSGRLAYYFNAAGTDFNTSATGAYGPTTSFPIFRASETHLLWAEAAARTGDDATALAQLNLAREYNNAVFAETSADYAATDAPVATSAALLQTIVNEEYVSLMSQIEVLSLMRRVDYQIQYKDSTGATVSIAPITGAQFPQRFIYPIQEINANPNAAVISTTVNMYSKTWANQP